LTLTTARYYTPYGRSLQRDYSNGSLYDYYVRHDPEEDAQQHSTSQPSQPASSATPPVVHTPTGPAVKTAAGRIFYGGGGITPDIDIRPVPVTPARSKIIEAAFYFTRELTAGVVPGLETYRVEKNDFVRIPRATDYPINERVLEAFRNFLKKDPANGLPASELDAELDFVKLRLREEILSAAFSAEAGSRVLLESDPQTLRALEALPDAKRLAESVRNGESRG